MLEIARIVEELRNEANRDFFDLSLVAGAVQSDLKLQNEVEIRQYTLEVVRELGIRGVHPFDHEQDKWVEAGVHFWPGSVDEQVEKIRTKWLALGKMPTLAEPICWFALRAHQST